MDETILEKLLPVTAEEQRFLQGEQEVEQSIYSSGSRFVVDAQKLLKKGNFLEIRPHTCFVHFPPHLHNYVEMVYMREGRRSISSIIRTGSYQQLFLPQIQRKIRMQSGGIQKERTLTDYGKERGRQWSYPWCMRKRYRVNSASSNSMHSAPRSSR